MSRRFVVDFYRVTPTSESEFSVADIIEQIRRSEDDEGRNEVINGVPMRMASIRHHRNRYEGDLTKIRMEEVPVCASLSGERHLIDLEDDEGIGEDTAFVYDPQLRIIGIQRNRYGVTASGFARYIERRGSLTSPLDMEIVIEPRVLQKLNRIREFRQMRFKIARLENGEVLRDIPTLRGLIDLIGDTAAPVIDVKLSVGHQWRDRSLSETIGDVVRGLLHAQSEDGERVDSIFVSGVNSADETEDVDLIRERLNYETEVELSQDRTVPFARRLAAVNEAWDNLGNRLGQMFRSTGG